jgi:hypothetical protein
VEEELIRDEKFIILLNLGHFTLKLGFTPSILLPGATRRYS